MAQTFGAEMIRCARNVARLQTRRRRLRRELKKIDADLKVERKYLRVLAARNDDADIVPSRVFGPGVGHKWRDGAEPAEKAAPLAEPGLDGIEPLAEADEKAGNGR